MHTLHLLPSEQSAFGKLPDALKEGWTVEAEKLKSFETAEQLQIRANMADFSKWPAMQALLDGLKKGQAPNMDSLESIPEEAVPELLFTIGASGISGLIGLLLQEIKNDEDLESVAGFSILRHDILEANASVPSLS